MELLFNIRAIEPIQNNKLYLLRGDVDGDLKWKYLLTDEANAKIIMALSLAFPLKMKLQSYGKIVFEGEGSLPPTYVRSNIAKADSSGAGGGSQTEVFCLLSKDDNGRDFYTYIEIPYFMVKEYCQKIENNEVVELTDYGKILQSGWGKPSDEVIKEMSEKYGVVAPAFNKAA